jgi:hypothetical protein
MRVVFDFDLQIAVCEFLEYFADGVYVFKLQHQRLSQRDQCL